MTSMLNTRGADGGDSGCRSRRILFPERFPYEPPRAARAGVLLPRLLTIMGSGETTPTMAKVHRGHPRSVWGRPVPAVILDTPYGFQENAEDITDRTVDYSERPSGRRSRSPRSARPMPTPLTRETALVRIRDARLVFTGPGSPSYALRQWAGSEIPRLLADKMPGAVR